MDTTLFVTGASSGIGAAFVAQAPAHVGRTLTFSRRKSAGEWIERDLARPGDWSAVADDVSATLDSDQPDHAIFFHCSGTMEPMAALANAHPDEYGRTVVLNFASGPALGQAFIKACGDRGIRATLVLTSSPAARKVLPMMSAYNAGKAAMEHWAKCAATEQTPESGNRVITVIPHAVLTDMVRGVLKGDPHQVPLTSFFRDVEAAGEFATPETTAAQIWQAIQSAANGDFVDVGALLIAQRAAVTT